MIEDIQKVVPFLLQWYGKNKRILPFRQNPTAYRIWVSEIMLQQTRIEAVIPHFDAFMKAFPTVRDLADADESKLLKLWEGLGYYSRARNLQKAAKIIVDQYDGVLPKEYHQLLSLPGIGEYTAGAIASIAYRLPVIAVDGNVLRVFARLFDCHKNILLPQVKKELSHYVSLCQPEQYPGEFNEAIMELGETICLPNTEPLCEACPFHSVCKGYLQKTAATLPVREKNMRKRKEIRTVFLITTNEKNPSILIQKRSEKGLLAGMWEYPNLEGKAVISDLFPSIQSSVLETKALPKGKHLFSHIEWELYGTQIVVKSKQSIPNGTWVTLDELSSSYAVPSAFQTYTRLLPSI